MTTSTMTMEKTVHTTSTDVTTATVPAARKVYREMNTTNPDKDWYQGRFHLLASKEILFGLDWSRVRVVFSPAPVKGYALVDTVTETVLGKGSRRFCETFLNYWFSAVQSVNKNLEKARNAVDAGDLKKSQQHIAFAKVAASKVDWNISNRIHDLRRPAYDCVNLQNAFLLV